MGQVGNLAIRDIYLFLYGTSPANQTFKQDIFQISSRIEDGEHRDRPPVDAIQNAVGPDDEFPPNR